MIFLPTLYFISRTGNSGDLLSRTMGYSLVCNVFVVGRALFVDNYLTDVRVCFISSSFTNSDTKRS